MCIAPAAFSAIFESFHNIDAHPSGEITEYILYSSINNLSETPIASAPPEPPSPIMTEIIGVDIFDISSKFFAIASLCPRSSAPSPGYAPGVSIKEIIGRLNFSANFINLKDFL